MCGLLFWQALLPACEVSIGSASCFTLTSGRVELRAAVLVAAGWVGEATVLAMEAGTGGVTAMAAGRAERTAVGWEGGTGAGGARRVGIACVWYWVGVDSICCSPPWLGRASTVAMTGCAIATWTSDLSFTLITEREEPHYTFRSACIKPVLDNQITCNVNRVPTLDFSNNNFCNNLIAITPNFLLFPEEEILKNWTKKKFPWLFHILAWTW